MSTLVFAVRRLAPSNLSWFHITRDTVGEEVGNERAININKKVMAVWYPEGIPGSQIKLPIKTKYLPSKSPNEVSNSIHTDIKLRPINLQGSGKNWRLGGDAIPGEFYGSIRAGDFMFMMFDTLSKELSWVCLRSSSNNSHGRSSIPAEEDEAFNIISALLGPFNADGGMWLPNYATSIQVLLQLYKLNDATWSLLSVEKYISLHNNKALPSSPKTIVDSRFPRNRIIYGAPGTGKSRKIDKEAGPEGEFFSKIRRVTFYPDYTYSQFVGSYKPFPVYRESTGIKDLSVDSVAFNKEPLIDYRLVPGPFMELLVLALTNRSEKFLLIIEEINRANVAAVFGDIFQLLDREEASESPYCGGSTYSITLSKDITSYLIEALHLKGTDPDFEDPHDPYLLEFQQKKEIRIPNNLYIWATMNSADQGVLPLDAAFKRRWSFEYLELDKGEEIINSWSINLMGTMRPWNSVRKCINDYLTGNGFRVSEDKLLGPFFMNQKELLDSNSVNNKLLLYLKDDVLRHTSPGQFFEKSNVTFSKLIAAANSGSTPEDRMNNVFCPKLAEQLLDIPTVPIINSDSEQDVVGDQFNTYSNDDPGHVSQTESNRQVQLSSDAQVSLNKNEHGLGPLFT